MLGLLAGHRRYAHITALRGDAVAAQALGMAKMVSEDALRRALERMDEAASAAWMRPALMHSVREALDRPLRSWSPLCDVLPFTRWRPAPTGDRHPPSRSPGASSWNRVESEA